MNFSNSSYPNNSTETEWFGILYQTKHTFPREIKTTTIFTDIQGKDTNTDVKIFIIILAGIFSCFVVFLFCFIMFNLLNEYADSRYYTDRTYFNRSFSSYDRISYNEDASNNSIISLNIQQTGNKETSLEPNSSIKLEETPLNEIVLSPGEDNLEFAQISCSICLEDIDFSGISPQKVTQLACGHIYHQDCISFWYFGGVSSFSDCPLCREKIDYVLPT